MTNTFLLAALGELDWLETAIYGYILKRTIKLGGEYGFRFCGCAGNAGRVSLSFSVWRKFGQMYHSATLQMPYHKSDPDSPVFDVIGQRLDYWRFLTSTTS